MIHGDPLSPKDIDAKLRAMSRLIGTQGPLAMAVTLIEIAAWDALAKTAELPLCRLLGSAPRPLPIYMTVPAMTPARVRELTHQALDRKYAGLKLKIGQADPAKDVALIEAARTVCGPDFPIMADFNQCLSVPEAIRRIQQMDDMGLAWFEEPTDAKNVAGHSRIAQAARTPISLGENWHSPLEAAQNMQSGAADLAMPDIIAIGGISAWLKTAAIAEIHGVPVSGHSYPEISTNLLPLTTMAHWLEHADIFDDLFLNPVKPVNGSLAASELPGFGIAWDEAVVARSLLQ
jgi:mandelate racemase